MKPACLLAVLWACPLVAQRGSGELRLLVSDASGAGLAAAVELTCRAVQVREAGRTDREGRHTSRNLPYGIYQVRINQPGFTPETLLVEIRSDVPVERSITLGVAALETTLLVTDAVTLLDPQRPAAAYHIGADALAERQASQRGRALLELVQTQPGWLLEANGTLHPRGAEYDTQYVVDGVPVLDNRSPAFAPAFDADAVQSMNIMTGGYPAEYGRKLGGVVEVVTSRGERPGAHGKAALDGGSFSARGGFLSGQLARGRNIAALGADGFHTGRYLDPPVEENYTNRGSGGGFTVRLERDFTSNDRLRFYGHRRESRFLVPNEREQELAGQRQDRTSGETMGQLAFQKILSSAWLASVRGMVRDISAGLWSNTLSTPIAASQDRGFREAYAGASLAARYGAHELKFGGDAIFLSLREQFAYRITNPRAFDAETPQDFRFEDRRQRREQSGFVQDAMRWGRWTFSAGLRFDHFRMTADETGVSPRLGAAWHWPAGGLVLRASYDRAFQRPAIENLLLAGSSAVGRLSDTLVQLPIPASRGNFYQAGFSKSLAGALRLDGAYFRRDMINLADDDVLLNTGVSFPVAFASGRIHGMEARLDLPRRGPFAASLSYSNLTGIARLPVTGGLFLEENAQALLRSHAQFPITQDQRNTARGRVRYQVRSRAYAALAAGYGSGLPVEAGASRASLLADYGQRIVGRVNFERERVRPSFSLDASAGVGLWKGGRGDARLQADFFNLTNRLNVINFAGLFSGTALAPARSFGLRFQTEF